MVGLTAARIPIRLEFVRYSCQGIGSQICQNSVDPCQNSQEAMIIPPRLCPHIPILFSGALMSSSFFHRPLLPQKNRPSIWYYSEKMSNNPPSSIYGHHSSSIGGAMGGGGGGAMGGGLGIWDKFDAFFSGERYILCFEGGKGRGNRWRR